MASRRTALVTQHLENISREALEKYQQILRGYIRNRQGIYALFRKGKLYYVGLAGNLRNRLNTHLKDRHAKSWDRFSVYLTIGDDHMKELESLILRIVKPIGNKVKGTFAKSENLLPRLKRDLKKGYEDEAKRLLIGKPRKAPASRRPKTTKPKKSKATGRRPILAAYKTRPTKLKARFKGKTFYARVRKDGTISFRGKIYNSPSLAAIAFVGHSANGWYLWTYERSPGDWVRLRELKKS